MLEAAQETCCGHGELEDAQEGARMMRQTLVLTTMPLEREMRRVAVEEKQKESARLRTSGIEPSVIYLV
jgi:hypothetical protein